MRRIAAAARVEGDEERAARWLSQVLRRLECPATDDPRRIEHDRQVAEKVLRLCRRLAADGLSEVEQLPAVRTLLRRELPGRTYWLDMLDAEHGFS